MRDKVNMETFYTLVLLFFFFPSKSKSFASKLFTNLVEELVLVPNLFKDVIQMLI